MVEMRDSVVGMTFIRVGKEGCREGLLCRLLAGAKVQRIDCTFVKSQIMKRILIPAVVLLAACTSPEAQPEAQISYDYFGDTVQVGDTTALSALLAQLQGGTDSVYGTFSAPISSVCQVKGCWMQLDLGNGEEALVRFKDYGFFVPMDAASEIAFVEGGLKVDTLSVEWLRHQAEDAGASDSAIAAITEPRVSYSVLATGVALAKKERAAADAEAEEHDHSSHEH
ncbi:MAG: hypothetical protein RL168_818 [Bacteroidota bacterium]